MTALWPIVLQDLLLAAALLLLIPTGILLSEVLLAITARERRAAPESGQRPRVAVLMPAHDEATVIAASLRALQPQLGAGDRLLVVADNCHDDTAAIARAHGAEVLERHDLQQRGKGFALEFGMRQLALQPPDVVVIVDADCQVDAGALDQLARRCARTGWPQQALYLMLAPEGAGVLRRLAQFAWLVRNQVRPLGLQRVGGPCQLMGSGMAFPWRTLARASLATGHIVEDLKLGIELAQAGHAPRFCPEARVYSYFPSSIEGTRSQRRRWEHGHLSLLLMGAPKLLLHSLQRGDACALALALDLAVPPLALLLLLAGAVWLASVFLALHGGQWRALACSSTLLLLLALAVLLAWARFGRRIVSLRSLALGGVYAVAKLPLYARFVYAPQLHWVRSRRSGERGK